MLKTIGDLHIAEFATLSALNLDEIAQADILMVAEKLPIGIFHSLSFRWHGDLTTSTDALSFIRSKRERATVQENKHALIQEGYTFKIEPVTQELYETFLVVYERETSKKTRRIQTDPAAAILGKVKLQVPIYMVSAYYQNQLVAGLVFSLDKTMAVVSLSAKPTIAHLRGGIGGVLELEFLNYCYSHKITSISHGKGNNPAGMYAKSGIFEFKARYGFSAFPEGYWVTTLVLNEASVQELVFVTSQTNDLRYKILTNSPEDQRKRFTTKAVTAIDQLSLHDYVQESHHFIASLH